MVEGAASELTLAPVAARTRRPSARMREEAVAELPSAEEPPFRMNRSVPLRVSSERPPRLQRNMEISRLCRDRAAKACSPRRSSGRCRLVRWAASTAGLDIGCSSSTSPKTGSFDPSLLRRRLESPMSRHPSPAPILICRSCPPEFRGPVSCPIHIRAQSY